MNSSKSPECPPWGSVSTVKAKIFPNTNKTDEGENVSMTNKVTPCSKNKHLSPKNVKNVVDEDKNESLKETKTESEVAFDGNVNNFVKVIRNEQFEEACDENTGMMNSIPGLQGLDENGARINYELDEGDEGDDSNDNNDNNSSLHDYHLS